MFGSPTFPRKFVTTSSNLSCPTSMQSVWRIVFTRIFLSVSLAVASSGGNGLEISISVVLCTGTLRCLSILAAADDAIGLDGFSVADGGPPSVGRPCWPSVAALVRVPEAPTWGIMMVSEQLGQ